MMLLDDSDAWLWRRRGGGGGCSRRDCVMSGWSGWTACTNGRATRSRHVIVSQSCGGTGCSSATSSKTCCNRVDCVMSSWGRWSACVSGIATRTRSIVRRDSCGGYRCLSTSMTKTCCNPVNCVWANWGSWSPCPIAGGTQRRTRSKAITENCGGACSGSGVGSKGCSCTKQNCQWNAWSPWSSCTTGSQRRSRTKSKAEACGGTCTGSYRKTQSCIGDGKSCGVQQVALTTSLTIGFASPFLHLTSVGGNEVKLRGKWPWAVSLQQKSNNLHYCGGTLIHSRWVLTAAHCIDYVPANNMEVVVGGHDLSKPDSKVQRFGVKRLIKHPSYHYQQSPLRVANDIALIELSSEATLNSRVQPACLTTDRTGFRSCQAVGWGWQNAARQGGGTTLQEVVATIVSQEQCEKVMGNWTTDGGIICAEPDTSAKVCGGDSGGPFICLAASSGQYAVAGVISFATNGCVENYEINTGLTDVAQYTAWIRQTCANCA